MKDSWKEGILFSYVKMAVGSMRARKSVNVENPSSEDLNFLFLRWYKSD